ncbi:MAG: putative selenium-dependent hydroxylase accessory protein YqeC [Chloroflexi bacterium HGW-Chloroflexi-8]|nr:MAG: putative selenium-dependent hydroxylase accessory protein YqeC [Chloroflexi bacterium HGW-Chloroflexi-8]
MKLSELDVFHSDDQIAWVGSGGKTSLIFSSIQELFDTAVVTTTTHLATSQASLASQHIQFHQITDHFEENILSHQVTLFTGGSEEEEVDKLRGFLPNELQNLSKYCFTNKIPLFIEADGARLKPIKAPAAHEPSIPDFVTKVCVVIGLEGLFKPLSEVNIHRPELFSVITGKLKNQVIDTEDIFKYLTSEDGGLKGIPTSSQKVLFLNQFDLIDDKDEILVLALRCKTFYDHVFITSVNQDSHKLDIYAHFGKIGCILLAAGEAKRFGFPKQLAMWENKSFIRTIIDKLLTTSLSPIFVILGAFSDIVYSELHGYANLNTLVNQDWKTGQASSVKLGINTLPHEVEAVIFLLVDQPQISIELINNLIISYAVSKKAIISYRFKGSNRHPVLFSKSLFSSLSKIEGNSGGRQLFETYPPEFIEISDPIQSLDFDTPEELDAIRTRKFSD